jgi:hypothetical protein
MTMTAEAPAGDSSPEQTKAVPGGAPARTGGAGQMAVRVFPGLPGRAAEARRWVRVPPVPASGAVGSPGTGPCAPLSQ